MSLFKKRVLIFVTGSFIIFMEGISALAREGEYLFNPLKQYFTEPLKEAFPKLELRGYLINETDILLHNTGDEPLKKPANAPGRHFEIKQNFQRIE